MTTLAQARKALNEAHILNTADAWQAAALAFAAASEAKHKPAVDPMLVKHTGKTPVHHVGRCTLADGYTVRVSIGQFKGETIADSLASLKQFTLDCYRADNMCVRAVVGNDQPPVHFNCYPWRTVGYVEYLPCRPWADGARLLHYTPEVVECRIVKYGSGPDAGIDLENPPMMAAAE